MDAWKIENFAREHTCPFPEFRRVGAGEAQNLRSRLAARAGLDTESSPLEFVLALTEQRNYYGEHNATMEGFDLRAVADRFGIVPRSSVYLNWYQFEELDEVGFDSLCRFFDDIWYPASDDLDIFDDTLTWLVSVAYNGSVSVRAPLAPR